MSKGKKRSDRFVLIRGSTFSPCMSSAEVAVRAFRKLENEDLRLLQIIETSMSKREFVPKEQIARYAELPMDRVNFTLGKLDKLGLVFSMKGAYVGYTLNYAGYDCLAINAFVKGGFIDAFGKSLGVGKEADVYEALTAKGSVVAVKFQRLGRVSFRQTRRKRGYSVEHSGWLFQSRLAAEREFHALKCVYSCGVSVPEPLSQNRHVIVMGMIEGAELANWKKLENPWRILRSILQNIRKAYLKASVIHADLSEYNIIVKDGKRVLIIDWPQSVSSEHPNAQELLERDIRNTLSFFDRRFGVKVPITTAMEYVSGKKRILSLSE